MDEHPNVTAVREWGNAMESGDMQAASAGLSPDVVWHEIGRSEPTRGTDALRARGEEMSDFDIRARTHDVVGNDEHVIQLVDVTATRRSSGESFDYRTAEIYHMRDGKITERWAFSDDTARILEFFGS
jgi:ketosteroid isomerase-like protein